MRVKCKTDCRDLKAGVEYDATSTDEGVIEMDGMFYYTDNPMFKHYFEVIEEAPQPAILNGHVETQEEIEDRWGRSGSDPLAIAAREIMDYQENLHRLVTARAQQIETNRYLLPMIDKLSIELPEKNHADNRYRIGEIKKFILAGSKG